MTSTATETAPQPVPGNWAEALKDTSTLVVGGSSGIGLAVARTLRAAGARVTVASRSPERLSGAAAALGDDVATTVADVADPASLDDLFAGLPQLDHVFVATGTAGGGPVIQVHAYAARPALHDRVWGAYEIARRAVPVLRPGGSLTFTSGITAARQFPGAAVVAASNAGLEALVRTLALEIAPLRANVVRPGYTDTPFLRGFLGGLDGPADDEQVAAFGRQTPLGRVARPEEVAAAVLFLMSNPYATGSTVAVDGGITI